ncbi:TetR/AcrR family transcriptional regulator [Nocardia sp. NPDC020380]|uniref:TetR/AcrR family transcriptional regulator n=1 Tax=Nocardia sp. NPDC020380 TaxID=3364309 RepID=UPI0037A6AB16
MSSPSVDRKRAGGRLGRQVEAERNDLLVLAAARAAFAEEGPDAPVASIAKRAGVGMGTLYRRYGSKEQLLQQLCRVAITETITALENALDRGDDGWTCLSGFIERCVTDRVGAFAPLAGSLPVPDDLARRNEEAKELLDRLVRRGHEDATVRPDVTSIDITYLMELFSRYPQHTENARHTRSRLLALAIDGLRPAATTLPEPTPSWGEYEVEWSVTS